ncbi:hypothetical protein [Micromonospora chersina]|uniref:hypothetical protein n=1 Tax=Micromonospora chersina TaxID=47854 RepID=UPI00371726CC
MTQRVVITGASAGVGRAVARAYGARGARLALLARGAEGVFTDRARRHSAALWVSAHKPAVSALTLGGLLLAAGGLARRLR